MEKIKKVCFTGHRKINNVEIIEERLTETLERLISGGATDFYAGGSYGFDMLCEKTILKIRGKYQHIKLHILLPCPENEQVRNWSNEDKEEYHKIILSADHIEICSEHYSENCMKNRNMKLIENADCCLCYYDNKKSASGTGQTVRMAQRKRIEVINLF